VVTTGATLTEAAAVLARQRPGAGPPVLGAVVAATPRRDPTGGFPRAAGTTAADRQGPLREPR
jgi:hypothetical protein